METPVPRAGRVTVRRSRLDGRFGARIHTNPASGFPASLRGRWDQVGRTVRARRCTDRAGRPAPLSSSSPSAHHHGRPRRSAAPRSQRSIDPANQRATCLLPPPNTRRKSRSTDTSVVSASTSVLFCLRRASKKPSTMSSIFLPSNCTSKTSFLKRLP